VSVRFVSLLLIAVFAGFSCVRTPRADRFTPKSFETNDPVAARDIDRALADGVAFLLSSQNADGSWGTGLQTRGYEIFSRVPGSHDAFRVGTSALCVMALREVIDADLPLPVLWERAGERAGRADSFSAVRAAHARGVRYLVEQGDARRDDGMILYNTWAHIYSLQALSIEIRRGSQIKGLRQAAQKQIDRLASYESYNGGWNYYDFVAQAQSPALEPTSFGTAAAILALREAQQAGLILPQGMMERAVRRVEECRLPDGSYLYGSDYRWDPIGVHNQVKGSIGRMQSCNIALWEQGSNLVGEAESVAGLKLLLDNHEWIAMGRKRPYPHEAWYATSGYYYYFGHFYAALILEKSTSPDRPDLARRLGEYVLPFQETDGSWWDYAMWDYHKPYGTAFAVMTLLRVRNATE
jgi:hypothetical protein